MNFDVAGVRFDVQTTAAAQAAAAAPRAVAAVFTQRAAAVDRHVGECDAAVGDPEYLIVIAVDRYAVAVDRKRTGRVDFRERACQIDSSNLDIDQAGITVGLQDRPTQRIGRAAGAVVGTYVYDVGRDLGLCFC
ncbi:MAG: hypothetical protein JNK76_04070 [Planctomycetales bacterium]|nr:hypothetical protein [Planctomycetales bacterium]